MFYVEYEEDSPARQDFQVEVVGEPFKEVANRQQQPAIRAGSHRRIKHRQTILIPPTIICTSELLGDPSPATPRRPWAQGNLVMNYQHGRRQKGLRT